MNYQEELRKLYSELESELVELRRKLQMSELTCSSLMNENRELTRVNKRLEQVNEELNYSMNQLKSSLKGWSDTMNRLKADNLKYEEQITQLRKLKNLNGR